MSTKNFVSYGDAETLFTGIGNKLSTLKSGLTNLDNEVNGDAVEYPYADVITIPDAVPANVAECSVKIEPVQDLHGQSAPYVGGAGKNMAEPVITTSTTFSAISFDVIKDADNNILGVSIGSGTTNDIVNEHLVEFTCVEGGTYKVIGAKLNGTTSINHYRTFVYDLTTASAVIHKIDYDETTVTLETGHEYTIAVYFSSGVTVEATTLQIMVCKASESSTFAPYTNICPISGHTEASVQRDGKNLFDYSTCENKAIDDNGMTWSVDTRLLSDFIAVSNTAYTVSIPSGIQLAGFVSYDSTKAFVSRTLVEVTGTASFTPTTPYIKLYFSKTDLSANISKDDVSTAQFERGSATTYTPYVEPKTYTIALGDTIYGGTVDFDTGVMTVDRVIVDLGTLTWQKDTSAFHSRFVANKVGMKLNGTVIADCFQSSTYDEVYSHIKDEAISISNAYSQFAIHSTYYEADYDATQFKTAMDGHYACYELATPFTVQLTSQQIQLLKGTNTLTASTGDISVTVNGVSGSIGAVQEQVNATDEALAEIAEKLPTAPTTDGAYVLTVTVADGTPTYSWESAT